MKEYKYKINGTLYKVGIGDIENGIAEVQVNGTPYKVEIEQKASVKVATPKAAPAPRTATGEKVITKATASIGGAGTPVKAPLPGTVLDINVTVGQEVKAADTVITLEAMKMENAIKAGVDGKVTAISVAKGDSVLEGAVLLTIA